MDKTKTITIDTEKELYNISEPEIIEPKRKGKSGVTNRTGGTRPKPPKFEDLDLLTQRDRKKRSENAKFRFGQEGYKTVPRRVRLAKKGGGRAYGKNS